VTIVGGRELTVGQLSARAGVAVSTLHVYEAKGLIRARRTSGNQRRYPRDTLLRIAFIRIAQCVGIPLATIDGALASLPQNRTPPPPTGRPSPRPGGRSSTSAYPAWNSSATPCLTASAAAACPWTAAASPTPTTSTRPPAPAPGRLALPAS
jgi:DNA-binding transcriptional MerR regulator